MEIPFQIRKQAGNYHYLHLKVVPDHRTLQASNHQLHVYLTLARKLSKGLNCYAMLPYSPYLEEVVGTLREVAYQYRLLADDFAGLGVDRGFQRTAPVNSVEKASQVQALFPLKDLLTLRSFPEDNFGEEVSAVSIFMLQPQREAALHSWFQQEPLTDLHEFLKSGELFIHITCGKRQGYFDGMIIRSNADIAPQISAAIAALNIGEHL